jgi:predicted nucleotidyltransferase
LAAQGIVTAEQAGNAYLYLLNRDHLAFPAVEALASLRERLIRKVRERVASWTHAPASAMLFGSFARQDGGVMSDIDILVVRPEGVPEEDIDWRNSVDSLAQSIYGWTGNHAGIVEVPQADIADFIRRSKPIIESLKNDGIGLVGLSPKELFS